MIKPWLLSFLHSLGLTNLSRAEIEGYNYIYKVFREKNHFPFSIFLIQTLYALGLTNLSLKEVRAYSKAFSINVTHQSFISESGDLVVRKKLELRTKSNEVVRQSSRSILHYYFLRNVRVGTKMIWKRRIEYIPSILSLSLTIAIVVVLYGFYNSGYLTQLPPIYVYILTALSSIILMLTVINFLNQIVLTALGRMREIGVRKVVGATNWELLKMYAIEIFISTLFALAFATGIIILGSNLLLDYANESGQIIDFGNILSVLFAVIGAIGVITILGALVQLTIYSKFSIVNALKGTLKSNRFTGRFRKVIAVFQVSISMALVSVSLVVFDQSPFKLSQGGQELELNRYNENYFILMAKNDGLEINHLKDFIDSSRFSNWVGQINQDNDLKAVTVIILVLTVSTMFIAGVGLLSLASFLTIKRRMEVGIRKVLGGTIGHILRLFLIYFFVVVLISTLIEVPISLVLANAWTNQSFTGVLVNLNYIVFPPLVMAIITLVAVFKKVRSLSLENPAEILRYQ